MVIYKEPSLSTLLKESSLGPFGEEFWWILPILALLLIFVFAKMVFVTQNMAKMAKSAIFGTFDHFRRALDGKTAALRHLLAKKRSFCRLPTTKIITFWAILQESPKKLQPERMRGLIALASEISPKPHFKLFT